MTVAEKILAGQKCAKCKTYHALPLVDKNQPAVKHVWYRNDTRYFTISHPLAERDGSELCYVCKKIDLKLLKRGETNDARILTY